MFRKGSLNGGAQLSHIGSPDAVRTGTRGGRVQRQKAVCRRFPAAHRLDAEPRAACQQQRTQAQRHPFQAA